MVEIKCNAADTVRLAELVPFQGELKRRSDKDIGALAESIRTEGLLMPFAVWENDNKTYILDGHGRKAALVQLALNDVSILEQDFPCIVVQAETEDDARKALLQIVSTCGKISPKGVLSFSSTVLDYHAPVLLKATQKVDKLRKPRETTGRTVLRISVPDADVQQLRNVLSTLDGVKVL